MNTTAVVRIYCTSQSPDYDAPWQARVPSSSTGSGVVVASGQVLTGAHVVAISTFLQVQQVEDSTRYTARLIGVCHDADLALLEINDPKFAQGVEAAQFRGLPELRQRVSVVGFPVGGQEVSITEGIVSRIELQLYSHSWREMLAITVDAAINSGNSGGPVFADDKVIGLAFQSHQNAENVGEIVPTVLIERFLRGVEEGRCLDVPDLSIHVQTLENPTLRRSLGMKDEHTGVCVRRVEFGGSADGVLQSGDVLLEIADHQIANNGTVRLHGFRTSYHTLLGERFVGDELPVRVWRDGAELSTTITLRARTALAERHRHDVRPRYVLYAGIVFQPLSRDFLATWQKWWDKAPPEFLHAYHNGVRTEETHERVVVSRVLADELTVGYTGNDNELVDSVNGVRIRSLAHLAECIDAAEGQILICTSWKAQLVFDTAEVAARENDILARYRITAARSDVL